MQAHQLLLSVDEVRESMPSGVELHPVKNTVPPHAFGNLIASVAADSAYASYSGRIVTDDVEHPVVVGCLALVFEVEAVAGATYTAVAQAAHMRTRVGEASVAVETVTAPSGLVSYWGFIHMGQALLVVTTDTLDPNDVSMTNFRSLVTAASDRLEARV